MKKILGGVTAVFLALLLAGCTKHYWESQGRGVEAFTADSSACIEDAMAKDRAAAVAGLQSAGRDQIYRRCMRERGWKRVETPVALDHQFRGPEDDEQFVLPPSPLAGTRYSCPGPGEEWIDGVCRPKTK
jgi:hypothetical protein